MFNKLQNSKYRLFNNIDRIMILKNASDADHAILGMTTHNYSTILYLLL